jgi:hypothetical protein
MSRLAIIGTAGRHHSEYQTLSVEHMKLMANKVYDFIENVMKTATENVILVSGGSAWADHIAVQLYLTKKFAGLELYLPSEFNPKKKIFKNTHEGRRLNFLHEQCQTKTLMPVLDELARVVMSSIKSSKSKVKIIVKRGFKQRNTLIACNNDFLIAFTFSSTDQPIDGGTADTWQKTGHNNKFHYSLS